MIPAHENTYLGKVEITSSHSYFKKGFPQRPDFSFLEITVCPFWLEMRKFFLYVTPNGVISKRGTPVHEDKEQPKIMK